MAVCQNLVPLVNIKIAGKWMFIPLKRVLIGIDPYPYDLLRSYEYHWSSCCISMLLHFISTKFHKVPWYWIQGSDPPAEPHTSRRCQWDSTKHIHAAGKATPAWISAGIDHGTLGKIQVGQVVAGILLGFMDAPFCYDRHECPHETTSWGLYKSAKTSEGRRSRLQQT